MKFVNMMTVEKDTCLDAAIVAQNASGKREHDEVIAYLNSINAHSNRLGSHEAVAKYLAGTRRTGTGNDLLWLSARHPLARVLWPTGGNGLN